MSLPQLPTVVQEQPTLTPPAAGATQLQRRHIVLTSTSRAGYALSPMLSRQKCTHATDCRCLLSGDHDCRLQEPPGGPAGGQVPHISLMSLACRVGKALRQGFRAQWYTIQTWMACTPCWSPHRCSCLQDAPAGRPKRLKRKRSGTDLKEEFFSEDEAAAAEGLMASAAGSLRADEFGAEEAAENKPKRGRKPK